MKHLRFLIDLWEVYSMKKRRKDYLAPEWQIFIEVRALQIFAKEITIDDVPNMKVVRSLVLEECEVVYHCDGYGNPLEKKNS